jgi:hypothetical protein
VRLQPVHRAVRFLRSGDETLDQGELMWAVSQLRPEERPLFSAMSPSDQAHSVRVARLVDVGRSELGGSSDDPWILRAALLHDVGKSCVPLGRTGRALGTVTAWAGAGSVLRGLVSPASRLGRVAEYTRYPELGASLLRGAGSDPRVVAWAEEHHRSPAAWTVPADAARLLASADDAS